MKKLILIAIAFTLAGCQASKGDPNICRPSNWSGELLVRQHASVAEAEDAFRQCLIHYTYLLAKDGGSADAVAEAVTARCQMASARFTGKIMDDTYSGQDYTAVPFNERGPTLDVMRRENLRLLGEIPNYIVEAKAGDCRP